MSTRLNVFIPRILANISATHLKNVFSDMQVGKVTYLDMRNRVNSNNYKYSFAFVTIDMYNTDIAKKLHNKIQEYGHAQLPYDDYNYWELKSFIPREQRGPSPSTVVTSAVATASSEEDEEEPEWMNNGKEWVLPSVPVLQNKVVEDTEPSIKDLCDDLMHYKAWTYPSPAITAQDPAYYPSSFLRTPVASSQTNYEFDVLLREIDNLRNHKEPPFTPYKLF